MVIGTGHVMRCLALADELTANGTNILFLCREHDGNLCHVIEQRGYQVVRLLKPRATALISREIDEVCDKWLGVSWQVDVQETLNAIANSSAIPDWIIVDHYALDSRWEKAVRKSSPSLNILAIDDLADRPHDCDVLLDQNIAKGFELRYRGLVSSSCLQLLGPKYALLQRSYVELHRSAKPRKGKIRRILVYFGGVDEDDLTGRTLRAWKSLAIADVNLDVVLPSSGPHVRELRNAAGEVSNIFLHDALPSLAGLIASADLGIGAGGTTSWERLCLGLPTLVVTIAQNQVAVAHALHEKGLIRLIGSSEAITENAIARELEVAIRRGGDSQWSEACLESVDGRGTARVYSAMTVEKKTPLIARQATESDENLILDWANDPGTRRNAFNPEPISVDVHRDWFFYRLKNPDQSRLYIVQTERNGTPVGQVRFEDSCAEWEIHYSLDRDFRGRGVGLSIVKVALAEWQKSLISPVKLFGRVKRENLASRKIFESLGFDIETDCNQSDVVRYSRVVARRDDA